MKRPDLYYFRILETSVFYLYSVSRKLDYTANGSKLMEKYFLDLRNIFLNQENIRNSFQNKKIYLAKKNLLVPSIRKFILIKENGLRRRTIFLE